MNKIPVFLLIFSVITLTFISEPSFSESELIEIAGGIYDKNTRKRVHDKNFEIKVIDENGKTYKIFSEYAHYSIKLPPGKYKLNVIHKNYKKFISGFYANPSNKRQTFNFYLIKSHPVQTDENEEEKSISGEGKLGGFVGDKNANLKLRNAKMTLISKKGKTYKLNTDDKGHYSIKLPAGRYDITVAHPYYENLSTHTLLSPSEKTQTFNHYLTRKEADYFYPSLSTGLRGHIIDRRTKNKLDNACIYFTSEDYKIQKKIMSEKDGGYTVSLPTGRYIVNIRCPGYRSFEKKFIYVIGKGNLVSMNYFIYPIIKKSNKVVNSKISKKETTEKQPLSKAYISSNTEQRHNPKSYQIALWPFYSTEKEETDNQLSKMISDLLFARLCEIDGIQLVDRTRIGTIFDEMAITLGQSINASDSMKIGQMSGADIILTGTLVQESHRQGIIIKAISTSTGILNDIAYFEINNDKIDIIVKQLAEFIQNATRPDINIHDRKFVAIGSFKDKSINNKLIRKGDEIHRILELKLGKKKNICLLSRSQLKPILSEVGLNEMGFVVDSGQYSKAQPGFILINGSYSLYRKKETINVLNLEVEFIGKSTENITIESLSWDEIYTNSYQKLISTIEKPLPDSNKDRIIEAKTHFEHGKKILNMGTFKQAHYSYRSPESWKHYISYVDENQRFIPEPKRKKIVLDAINAFESAVFLDPEYYEAMIYLALCYLNEYVENDFAAEELCRKVISRSKNEFERFMAAEIIGITEQVTFSKEFAEKVLTLEYDFYRYKGKVSKLEKNPETTPSHFCDVIEKCIQYQCEFILQRAEHENLRRSHFQSNAFHILSERAQQDAYYRDFRKNLIKKIQKNYPTIAPHFMVKGSVWIQGSIEEAIELLPGIESGRTIPQAPDVFYDYLSEKLLVCVAETKFFNYSAAYEIGSHMQRQNILSDESKVYFAFCLKAMGDDDKAIDLLEQIPSEKVSLDRPGPWGQAASFMTDIFFTPKKTAIKWKKDRALQTAKFKPPEIDIKKQAIKIPSNEGIRCLFVQNSMVIFCSYRVQEVISPVVYYDPKVYIFNTLTGKLSQLKLPFSVKGMITSIVMQPDDILWLGTDQGLFAYRYKNGQYKFYGEKQGLLKPGIRSLLLSKDKLYLALESGFGYLDLSETPHHFYGLITDLDYMDIASSSSGVWVITNKWKVGYKKNLKHFAYTDDRMTFEKFLGHHGFCLAANEKYVVSGQNDIEPGRATGFYSKNTGGIIIYDKTSMTLSHMKSETHFHGPDVFALAFEGENLWVGGRGFLAVVDCQRNRVLAQTKADNVNFSDMFPDKNGVWIAADNELLYLSKDAIIKPVSQNNLTAYTPQQTDVSVLNDLLYDGTQESLRKIQEAVMPAVREGNIIALNICRQAMHGLSDDMGLEKIAVDKYALKLDTDIVDAWFSAVRAKADSGDSFFQTVLGILYFNGDGAKKDNLKCKALWEAAALSGYHDALLKIGTCYKTGRIYQKNLTMARKYYQQAGEAGSALALYNIGCMYNEADGVEEDKKKACEYWKKSAAMGHAWSQFNLGLGYVKAEGVEYDLQKGKYWIKKAAGQGHQRAKEFLRKRD